MITLSSMFLKVPEVVPAAETIKNRPKSSSENEGSNSFGDILQQHSGTPKQPNLPGQIPAPQGKSFSLSAGLVQQTTDPNDSNLAKAISTTLPPTLSPLGLAVFSDQVPLKLPVETAPIVDNVLAEPLQILSGEVKTAPTAAIPLPTVLLTGPVLSTTFVHADAVSLASASKVTESATPAPLSTTAEPATAPAIGIAVTEKFTAPNQPAYKKFGIEIASVLPSLERFPSTVATVELPAPSTHLAATKRADLPGASTPLVPSKNLNMNTEPQIPSAHLHKTIVAASAPKSESTTEKDSTPSPTVMETNLTDFTALLAQVSAAGAVIPPAAPPIKEKITSTDEQASALTPIKSSPTIPEKTESIFASVTSLRSLPVTTFSARRVPLTAAETPAARVQTSADNPMPILNTPSASSPATATPSNEIQTSVKLPASVTKAKPVSLPVPTAPFTATKSSVEASSTSKPQTSPSATAVSLPSPQIDSAISSPEAIQGKEIPVSDLVPVTDGKAGKEKKSTLSRGEGSFLQDGTKSAGDVSSSSAMSPSTVESTPNTIGAQQVTPSVHAVNSNAKSGSDTTSTSAGIANVERNTAMNADTTIPQLEILSSLGANGSAASQQTASEMNILLGSNNDFKDALRQVMHVASITEAASTRIPTRVAIEIHTPPGAVVNVYVSQRHDQYRAQLSTSDPVALRWVQDQMSSLKSSDLGVPVNWLPPQIESNAQPLTAVNIATGQENNLGWDRGGQGQSNDQQPDERSQSRHQEREEDLEELAGVGANHFMETLSALGRAA